MSKEMLTILDIEDDPVDAELLGRTLSRIENVKCDLIQVRDESEARTALERVAVDALIVDYRLGGETGLDLIQKVRSRGELRPIICLTEYSDPNVVKELFQAGADDYLLKSELNPQNLRRALEHSMARYHQRQAECRNEQLLAELKVKSEQLEKNNRRLAELYETAHEFVDNVSHEFRTPLTVIREFASIIRDGLAGPRNEQQAEYLSLIVHRTDDLSMMVDDMLDMSRLEAGLLGVKRVPCRMEDIIERVRVMLERRAATSKVTIDFESADHLPEVYCDPDRIGRVLINLTVNAVKFSPEGGLIRIATRPDPKKDEVTISVTDQGAGIAQDQLSLIFERFHQIDSPTARTCRGFGLGLGIAQELVKLNLGDMNVVSEVGRGSTFLFTIPYSNPLTVMERYLDRFSECELTDVSLIVASTDEHHPESVSEAEDFIHHHVRANDLVFQIDPTRWFIVAPRTAIQTDAAIAALDRALAEANRNRPGRSIPHLEFESLGAWTIPASKRELLDFFERAIHPKEVPIVGKETADCR